MNPQDVSGLHDSVKILCSGSPKTQKTAAPAPANQKTGRETAPARLIWCGTVSSLPAVWKIILINPHIKLCQLLCASKYESTVYILKRSV